MNGVHLTEVVGKTPHKQGSLQSRKQPLRMQRRKRRVQSLRYELVKSEEAVRLADINCAKAARPIVHVAEQMPVNRAQMRSVEAASQWPMFKFE
ncbi:hypothetical protein F183_A31830 [Bryobacterales bacterium F-183]|nr:hypothetical protein F183_A31830 [Bryobacterales bacterium F-183]